MIRILNKPSLKEWTTTQLFKPAAGPTRSFSGCRRPFPSTHYALARSHVPFPHPSLTRIGTLHYSTVPDSARVKANTDSPPPANPISRKPKVDLRPAPKKINREPCSNAKRTHPAVPSLQPKSVPSSLTSAPPVASESSPGTSKAMQHDIAEATKHGILTPPPEGVNRVHRLWHQFVQLFKFYWSGLKMIFVTHRQQAAEIRRRAAEAKANGQESGISRWETRFLRTYDRDLVKLVPFILTLIILEEALPLVVLYAPGLLPSTCLLPSQRERIEAKRRTKQMEHLAAARTQILPLGQHSTLSLTENGVKSLSIELARTISGALSRSTWGPLFLQQRRIEKRLAYLSSDDALLIKEDLGARLKEEELIEALEERGLVPESRSLRHLREQLQWWLRGAQDDNARMALILQAAIKGSGEKMKAEI